MDKVTQTGKTVHFGPYDVDLVGQELRKGGIRIRLQPKPFQVLAVLLEHGCSSSITSFPQLMTWTVGAVGLAATSAPPLELEDEYPSSYCSTRSIGSWFWFLSFDRLLILI